MLNALITLVLAGLFVSCSGGGGSTSKTQTSTRDLEGSIGVPNVNTGTSSVTLPSIAPTTPSVPSAGPTTAPSVLIPSGPNPVITWTPVQNELLLISTGYSAKVSGMWRGPCSIYSGSNLISQCYLDLDIKQGSGTFCPEVIDFSPNLTESRTFSNFSVYLDVRTSLNTYVAGSVGVLKNNLMSEVDCEIEVNFPPNPSKKITGTIGQGGLLYKGPLGNRQLKLVLLKGGIQLEYKTGNYVLVAVLQ